MTGNSVRNQATAYRTACLALPVLAAAVLGLSVSTATVQAADASVGKTLALQWCSSCHLVAEDQKTASSVSLPSFYDMAGDPGWTEETLATFLADPHPKMPNMSLQTREIADLARYISSLQP
ncbi:c-type cytochrome [Roseibium porphyridii]|uniref:C-type cytochrome n=1 Tax=Roseibium porphyridii TaxID=2866279 RepID=A0ABY8F4M1_9HYPH|nr:MULTISPECIES: c-type cytochrome [Stappiaceae]QFT29701.1 Cytochrome c-552 precursor [Labrenzia sp. THAF82]WFE90427.1 c-type cytochrome [Roseibium sp. KMA01]